MAEQSDQPVGIGKAVRRCALACGAHGIGDPNTAPGRNLNIDNRHFPHAA